MSRVGWLVEDHSHALGGGSWVTMSPTDAEEAEQAGCTVTPVMKALSEAEIQGLALQAAREGIKAMSDRQLKALIATTLRKALGHAQGVAAL